MTTTPAHVPTRRPVPPDPERDARRRAAARIPLTPPRGLRGRLVAWYSRRAYGDVLDNGLAMLQHPGVLRATLAHERQVARLDVLDPTVRALAELAAASAIGCSWCIDFGSYQAHRAGADLARLREVPRWRDSTVFTAGERRVLAFAEDLTATPPVVTDEQVAALVRDLGVPGVVELVAMVAVENQRSRFNAALGLTSQGFTDRCGLGQEGA